MPLSSLHRRGPLRSNVSSLPQTVRDPVFPRRRRRHRKLVLPKFWPLALLLPLMGVLFWLRSGQEAPGRSLASPGEAPKRSKPMFQWNEATKMKTEHHKPAATRRTTEVQAPKAVQTKRKDVKIPVSISFPLILGHTDVQKPPELFEESNGRDYGGLEIRFFEEDNMARAIYHNVSGDEGEILRWTGHDFVEQYYAFDDDYERNTYRAYDDPSIADEKRCRRVSWHRNLFINCNNFHELDILGNVIDGETKSLGGGSYRDVFSAGKEPEKIVFKESVWPEDDDETFTYSAYEALRMDMLVSEIFSSNPIFVDIYGFCGLSMMSEYMPYGDTEKVAQPVFERGEPFELDERSAALNDLLPGAKLTWALEMAEAVQFLHNYKDGVIVHDDIQLAQFLLQENGHLKINDFNRAEPMLFDVENQEYCRYRNNPGHGDWRSPEEYFDYPLNEKIDIWSLGNNFFAMLTGLSPFPHVPNHDGVKKRLMRNETATIDPIWHEQSFAERKLAEIIPLCWKIDPDERIDISSLVKLLREAADEYARMGGDKEEEQKDATTATDQH